MHLERRRYETKKLHSVALMFDGLKILKICSVVGDTYRTIIDLTGTTSRKVHSFLNVKAAVQKFRLDVQWS